MLRRDISAINLLVVAAGSMVGSGWLFSSFISARIAGPEALIGWALAAIFIMLIALPLCELGSFLPISGGLSNYPTFTHGKEVGFVFAWISWLGYVVMTPIEIQAVLQYASYFFPALIDHQSPNFHLTHLGYLAAFIALVLVTLLNSMSIRLLAECGKYIAVFKFIVPILAIITLFYVASKMHSPSGGWSNLRLDVTHRQSWINIFSALSTGGIVFAFMGFQNGLVLAGEVRNPQRNIPIAVLGAVVVGFLLYALLQTSFLVAMPSEYFAHGWQNLHFPGDSSPLVGLTLLLGFGVMAIFLLIDSAVSPLGTAIIYTTATSRILYGMAMNQYLPPILLKLNRYKIPYVTLIINFVVGILSFLPFSGWQKMATFLSSAGILSYSIGPICLMALRKLQPEQPRPFRLSYAFVLCCLSFYVCNLMLHWCGFSVLWKLYMAMWAGLVIHWVHRKAIILYGNKSLQWFLMYMTTLLFISWLGPFEGQNILKFPYDIILLFPVSIALFIWSQRTLMCSTVVAQKIQGIQKEWL